MKLLWLLFTLSICFAANGQAPTIQHPELVDVGKLPITIERVVKPSRELLLSDIRWGNKSYTLVQLLTEIVKARTTPLFAERDSYFQSLSPDSTNIISQQIQHREISGEQQVYVLQSFRYDAQKKVARVRIEGLSFSNLSTVGSSADCQGCRYWIPYPKIRKLLQQYSTTIIQCRKPVPVTIEDVFEGRLFSSTILRRSDRDEIPEPVSEKSFLNEIGQD
jgi:hypothetical protein